MPGVGLEPTRPHGQPGLSRPRISSSATRARPGNRTATLDSSNFPTLVGLYERRSTSRVEASALTTRRLSRPSRSFAPAQIAVGRASRRARAAREPGRLRGARRALPVAAAGVLPPHAVLEGGRRGRAAGGLRRRVQRDARRRARDQRAAVALPDRPQPLAEPPAPRAGGRRRLDGHPPVRGRADDRGQGPQARGVPPARRRRPGPARRRSAPRCCCARSTRSPTSRSPRRWRRRCRPSSRCSCAPACRSPRRPRRGC